MDDTGQFWPDSAKVSEELPLDFLAPRSLGGSEQPNEEREKVLDEARAVDFFQGVDVTQSSPRSD